SPKEVAALYEEPARQTHLDRLFERLLDPGSEALDSGTTEQASSRFRPVHRTFHIHYLGEKVRQPGTIDEVHLDAVEPNHHVRWFIRRRRRSHREGLRAGCYGRNLLSGRFQAMHRQ